MYVCMYVYFDISLYIYIDNIYIYVYVCVYMVIYSHLQLCRFQTRLPVITILKWDCVWVSFSMNSTTKYCRQRLKYMNVYI